MILASNITKTVGLYTCVAWKIWSLNDYFLAVGITTLIVSWYMLKSGLTPRALDAAKPAPKSAGSTKSPRK